MPLETGSIEKNRYLWCKKCQNFPEEIIEMYDFCKQNRKWNGEDYEATEAQELGDSVLFCSMCETQVEEKVGVKDENSVSSKDTQSSPAEPTDTDKETRSDKVS